MKIKKLFWNLTQTWKLFLLSHISLVALTTVVMCEILWNVDNYEKLLLSLILIFLLSLFWPMAKIHSSGSSKLHSQTFYIISQVVAAVLWTLYYIIVPSEIPWFYASELRYLWIFLIVIIWIFLFVSFLVRNNENKTRYSRSEILVSWFFWVAASGILFWGVAWALAAIEALFDVYISSDRYECLWAITMILIDWALILNFYYTAMLELPKKIDFSLEPSRMRKIFGSYIFLPLSIIYLLIFFFYWLKILITGVWPKWVIVWLWLGYFGLWLVTTYFVYPEESKTYKKINQILYISFFFIAWMMIWAIAQRINQYGVTMNRYLVCTGILEMILFSILALCFYNKRLLSLAWTAFLLAIISMYGRISAPRISIISQQNRIDSVLEKEQISLPLWSGSLIQLTGDSVAMLYWSLQEISQNYAPESRMNKYLTKEFISNNDFYSSWNTWYKVKEFLWLEYTYQEINLSDNYFYFYSKSNNQIDVSWYNTLYMLDDLYQKDGEWDNIFMIDFEDWNHETIDLKPYLNDLYNVSNVFKETFTGEYFIIEEDNKKIILTSVNWEKQWDEIIITSIYWYLLTR